MKNRKTISLIIAMVLSLAIFAQNIHMISVVRAAEPAEYEDEEGVDPSLTPQQTTVSQPLAGQQNAPQKYIGSERHR